MLLPAFFKYNIFWQIKKCKTGESKFTPVIFFLSKQRTYSRSYTAFIVTTVHNTASFKLHTQLINEAVLQRLQCANKSLPR